MQEKDIAGEAFNLSSGIHINVLDLVNKILKLIDKILKPKILNEANHEIRDQYLSIDKAKKIIGLRPHFNLDTGLKRTIDWYIGYFSDLRKDS